MNDRYTVEPVSIDSFRMGMNGKRVVITADTGDIAKKLQEISPTLKVDYAEAGEHFIVYQEWQEGETTQQKLVLTCMELDDRVVNRCRYIGSEDYDYTGEALKKDLEAFEAKETARKEEAGEMGEKLAFALRKDLGYEKDSQRSKKAWGKK